MKMDGEEKGIKYAPHRFQDWYFHRHAVWSGRVRVLVLVLVLVLAGRLMEDHL